MDVRPSIPVPPPGCPAHALGGPVPLYGPDFVADPHAYYDYLRHFGSTAPVELAPGVEATLVTDYQAALRLLQNPASFRKDARGWRALNEGRVPADSPVVPLLVHKPNAMYSDGAEHIRLRQAITDAMERVDARRVKRTTEQASNFLIDQFGYRGSADLLGDYATQLTLLVFNELFGCSPDIGDRVLFGISGMFDGTNAEQAKLVLAQACGELVAEKRSQPGEDVTSWLLQHHARLTDEEVVYQLALLLGAGTEPLGNLIGNTLHRLLTEDKYDNGGLIDEAIDATLWENPPMANFAPHYAAADMEFAGKQVRKGDLMVVSFAAANTSPELTAARQAGSRAHLAWSAGPHACPSKEPARQITVTAIENLFNRVPDVVLAVPEESLRWRAGALSRGLVTLPTRFKPIGAKTYSGAGQAPQGGSSVVDDENLNQDSRSDRGGTWSKFLSWLRS